MQAITITFKGPTERLGDRWVAQCAAGKVTLPHEWEFSHDGNVQLAVIALCRKLGWTYQNGHIGRWVVGNLWQGPYVATYLHENASGFQVDA